MASTKKASNLVKRDQLQAASKFAAEPNDAPALISVVAPDSATTPGPAVEPGPAKGPSFAVGSNDAPAQKPASGLSAGPSFKPAFQVAAGPGFATGSKLAAGVILFALFSCAGWVYETVENVFTFGGLYLRAQLMLPWCPIYGIGGLIIVAALEPVRARLAGRVPFAVQLIAIMMGIFALAFAVELAGSYVCEAVMGYVPWDYSHAWGNFDGRVAPAYTARFVVLGLIALYIVYPPVMRFVRERPHAARMLAACLAAAFVLDYALQLLGVWGPAKDALVPYGINHW